MLERQKLVIKLHQLHPLLTKFSLEAASVILQSGNLIHVEPGQYLYQKQDLELKVYLIIFGSFQITSEERAGPVTYLEMNTNSKVAASAVGVNKTAPNVEDLD